MSEPRGLRNCNPLNLEKGDDWQGLADEQPDSRFCTFKTPQYGFRAAAVILRNYQVKHGCWSIHDIVSRWAPPGENDTPAYIAAVAQGCKADASDAYPLTSDCDPNLRQLLRAMCVHENGACPYEDSMIDAGIAMARQR